MRKIRFLHFVYLSALLVLDSFLNVFVNEFLSSKILFISNLHFLGLILLTQNDSKVESVVKAFLLGMWMDLTHVSTFPVFMIAYTGTIIILRWWDRHIGSSTFEYVLIGVVGLFIKEVALYILIVLTKNLQTSFMSFLAFRTFWVILGNVILCVIPLKLYQKMHSSILKQAQNIYVR
ncbi:MAG: hypothetical protein RR565_05825 [Erysipelothrix sp.]